MGSYSSGRPTTNRPIEGGLRLSLSKLMKDGMIRPDASYAGTLTWTNTGTGESVATMGFQTDMRENSGRVRLHYVSTMRSGQRIASDYWIDLTTMPQPFGGYRWYFNCPVRGVNATVLYLPAGATKFGSRKTYRLSYRSQRQSPRDRALDRAQDIRKSLGGTLCTLDPFPGKPKWMRWPTYFEKVRKARKATATCDAWLAAYCDKISPGWRDRALHPRR